MEKELEEIKNKLKKTETKVQGTIGKEITEEESSKIRSQFFDSGAQNWYEIIESLTFSSLFLPLERKEAQEIILSQISWKIGEPIPKSLQNLSEKIDLLLKKNNWKRAFIKLSTRSPKDSALILLRGLDEFKKNENLKNMNYEQKIVHFSECVQNNFYIETGLQAIELLISSERVTEDLKYAFETEPNIDFLNHNIHIVLRQWEKPVPISNEFRGFVWNGNLNAIGQYYHNLYFPWLKEKTEKIEKTLIKLFENNLKEKLPKCLQNSIVDFAYFDDGKCLIIELNPFDAKALGSFPGSTGLFDLENKKDLDIIQNGPFEFRIRENPLTEKEIKIKLNNSWKEALKNYL